jgi:hypothetical protein
MLHLHSAALLNDDGFVRSAFASVFPANDATAPFPLDDATLETIRALAGQQLVVTGVMGYPGGTKKHPVSSVVMVQVNSTCFAPCPSPHPPRTVCCLADLACLLACPPRVAAGSGVRARGRCSDTSPAGHPGVFPAAARRRRRGPCAAATQRQRTPPVSARVDRV